MFTRAASIRRNIWTSGPTGGTGFAPPHVPGWRAGVVVGAGPVPLILPAPVIMMDPSNRATWTTPVRWT